MPLLAPRVPMPKESIHSCIPLIASQYSRGFTLGLNLTHTFGITADASRCARVIHQGGFGGLESCTGSGYPSWPRTCLFLCEARKGGGFNCPYFVGCHPKNPRPRMANLRTRRGLSGNHPWSLIFWCVSVVFLRRCFSFFNFGSLCCFYLFISSTAVNTALMRSTSPSALSTSPPNSTNGSVNDAITTAGPDEPSLPRRWSGARETAGLAKRPRASRTS